MNDWSADDRRALQLARAQANSRALWWWSVVVMSLALALALVLAPSSALGPLAGGSSQVFVSLEPPLALLAASSLGLLLLHLGRRRVETVGQPVTVALVAVSGVVLGWVTAASPATAPLVAAGFVLVSVSAGQLFWWDLGPSVALQIGLLACWLLGVKLGPGWLADAGLLGASTTVLLGAMVVSIAGQRRRRQAWRLHFQQRRDQDRMAREVEDLRASQVEHGRGRDRLFSDVTNGLREPVVRLLRAMQDQADSQPVSQPVSQPDASPARTGTWQQGLRLLRKLDDVGTLALYHRGHFRLRVRRVKLEAALTAMIQRANAACGDSGVSIELFIADLPDDIHVDSDRVERVMVVMLAETLRRCPADAEIQVEVGSVQLTGQLPALRVEVWCDAPEEPIDRATLDDFWREPEGLGIELRLAYALAEFHGGRLVVTPPGAPTLSAVLTLRAGTQHLTDSVVDRRVRAPASERGRRFEDRDGMTWAADLARSVEYRFLDVQLMASAVKRDDGLGGSSD